MKSKMIVVTAVLLFASIWSTDKAHAVFFSWGGETIEKIADFPDTYAFRINDDFIDAGIRYQEFTILFLPMYQYAFEWCGYVPGKSDIYYDLSRQELVELANIAQVQLPDEIKLEFWKAWGGKLVLVLIIVIWVGYTRMSHREEVE